MGDALIKNEIPLKNGQILKNPSLFVELKRKREANLVRETIFRYPINNDNHDGINQIDGFNIPLSSYADVAPHLHPDLKSAFDENHYSIDKRIRLIDPSLYLLFMGSGSDKKECCDVLKDWLPSLPPIVESISDLKSLREKADRSIREIYPLLDVVLAQKLFEYQIKNNASILINPSVPISSSRMIKAQVEKMREMNRVGRVVLNTLLTRFKTKRDLMNMATLSPSVLISANRVNILDAIMQGEPDIIGIRLMNLDEKKSVEMKDVLKFIESLSSSGKPTFVFNVREFGYVAFCYGACVVSMPIAKSPYTTRKKGSERPIKLGSYYHYYDMIDYSYVGLREKILAKNYALPCHCEICNHFGSLLKIDKRHWNYFRKVHFLLVKNMEMQEFRKTQVPLNIALKDKFGRSLKTGYVSLLP